MLQEVAKKVVSTLQIQAACDYLQEQHHVSQRRAAKLMGRAHSTVRYRRRVRQEEDELCKAIRRLARRRRFGYKIIHACLWREGWHVDVKRGRR